MQLHISAEPMEIGKIIAGAPKSWQIEEAKDQSDFDKYPQYRVIIPIGGPSVGGTEDTIASLVPKAAVDTSVVLRYIQAVLKTGLVPAILTFVQRQIEEEMEDSEVSRVYNFSAGRFCHSFI